MKKFVSIVLVILTLAALMIPAFAGAEGTTKWVNCENGKRLNVRDSVKGNLLYRIDCGTKVEIQTSVSTPKGWAYITVPGHAKGGYVMTKFLVASKPGKYEMTEREDDFKSVKSYTVVALARTKNSAESVGLRTKPNKTATAIRRLMAGDELTVIAVGKTWSKVKDPQTGKTGYVANDYIAKK